MTKQYFSKFSDGTNTYEVKDAEARTALEGKQATLSAGTNITLNNNTVATTAAKVTIKDWSTVTPTETDLNQFIINKLTKEQYEGIDTPDANQFYMVTDDTGITVDSSLSTTSENPVQNKVITTALNGKADSSSLATVATTGSYTDLSNKPTIPTVNNATLTIKRNNTAVDTFTANASEDKAINISVPTTVAELTDASNYVLSSALATVATSGSYNDLSNKPTIPTITDTYSRISSDGMSGKAVASAIDTALASVYTPVGSTTFDNLPTPANRYVGNVFNVTDAFTTTSDFVEGAGKSYPAGTNVACVQTGPSTFKYDVLAGFVDLSGYQETSTAVTHTASTAVGSATQPVYIASDGTATAITYELNKTVPADAVFTDTTYSAFTGAQASSAGTAGLVPAPASGETSKFLKSDGTWATTPDNDTKNTAGATDTSSKIYLVGATAQDANPQTYTQDTAFVDANGRLNSAAPASDANDTTVATTKWVKDQSYQASSTAVTHTASTAVGSATQPVYIDSTGVATATTYSLAKSVPADAVFTDTTYSVFTGADGSNAGTAGLVKAPAATDNTKFLKGDGTWADTPNDDTKNTAGSTDTSSKIYLIGATTQAANPQTYSHDTAFVDTNGRLNSAAPASDANDTTVATTKWVKDQGYKTSSGVTSVAEGSANGTIAVSVDGGTATNVSVHGLGSAAYTASSAYATANHTHTWTYDSSTETLTFGSAT